MRHRLASMIARMLPNKIKFYVGVYIVADATSGKYSKTVVPELTAMEALDRFYNDRVSKQT